MPKAETIDTTLVFGNYPDIRDLVASVLDLVSSLEPTVSSLSPQQRADVLLAEWNRNRHLPPALRLSGI
jgi:hypothetical protein